MILYNDCITFNILGKEIEVISSETEYGLSTVVDFDGKYYYLGNEPPNLDTVVFAWQDYYNVQFSDQDLKEITNKN